MSNQRFSSEFKDEAVRAHLFSTLDQVCEISEEMEKLVKRTPTA